LNFTLPKTIIGCWLVIVLFWQTGILAQSVMDKSYILSTEQGLSENTNFFIYKDTQGFLWISSTDGLNRFDGRTIKVYRPDPQEPLHSMAGRNLQSEFYEDAAGDLWFTTEEAINCYRRAKGYFEHYYAREKAVHRAFLLEQQRYLWVQVDSTLYRFDTKTRKASPLHHSEGVFYTLQTNAQGQVTRSFANFWSLRPGFEMAEYDTQFRMLKKTSHLTKTVADEDMEVFMTSVDSNTLWLATNHGLAKFDLTGRQKTQFFVPPATVKKPIVYLRLLSDEHIATIANGRHLYFFDKKTETFSNPVAYEGDTAPLERVLSFSQDSTQSTWISILGKGVICANLSPNSFRKINIASTVTSKDIRQVIADQAENLWFINAKGQIYPRWATKHNHSLPRMASGVNVFFDPDSDQYWALSYTNIYLYQKSTHKLLKSWPTNGITVLRNGIIHGGYFLYSTLNGVYRMHPQQQQPQKLDGLNEMAVSFHPAPANRLWIGTDISLKLCDLDYAAGKLKVVTEYKNTGIVYQVLYNERSKKNWVATSSGILSIDPNAETYQRIAFQEGVPHPAAVVLLQDSTGYLWAGTNQNLLRFDPLHPAMNKVYTTVHGLRNTGFNPGAGLVTADGIIWLGGSQGVDVFDPASLKPRGHAPQPALVGLKIHDAIWRGDSAIEVIRHLNLPYNQNTLRLEMAALEYLGPSRNQFKVRLQREGETLAWTDLGTQNFVTYANLQPGRYCFQFIACNAEGLWTDESAARTLWINIRPHWSQTWWFRSLLTAVILSFVAALTAFYYRYQLHLQQLAAEKQLREAERQRLELEKTAIVAEGQRKAAESEMKLLRSQLNPHFLFNAMNSINRYILSNEKEKASEYLGEFARLTRSILDNSRNLVIPLADELSMLGHYLALENHRFQQQIHWTFTVSPDLDAEDVQVPSMFLQPFAENAVLHGLAPQKGGHIAVEISEQAGSLQCILRDNGVGRRARPVTPNDARPKHASVGMSLIAERLDAFAALEGQTARFDIIDLHDDQGQPCGTEVVIRLPLKTIF
jgi:ligand-binding sensor domain-containing protein